MYKKIKYEIGQYNFQKMLKNLYEIEDLGLLHECLEDSYLIPDDVGGLGSDTTSIFHKRFYDKLDNGWDEIKDLYKKFVIEVIKPLFPEEDKLIYQSFPSFRIQYPNNRAITTVHTDNDKYHQHPAGEISFTIPLTKMYDTSATWVESFPAIGDFSPMEGEHGDLFMWDGNRCAHYNKFNITGYTRISFDFRILPNKFYDPNYSKTTVTTGKKFLIGHYYSCDEGKELIL